MYSTNYYALNLFLIILYSSLAYLKEIEVKHTAERCQCGKFLRDKERQVSVNGQVYDTLMPLGDGLDSSVRHAYSPALGKCVAIKRCSEQIWLNKCTREVEVLKAMMNGTGKGNGNIVPLYNYEIQRGQKCEESSLLSDYLRIVIIGSDKKKRRKRRQDQEAMDIDLSVELNNCTVVTTVMELGLESATKYWKEDRNKAKHLPERLANFQSQVQTALDLVHRKGMAHRDVHPENVVLFGQSNVSLVWKLIDFGWTCCFDSAKCGPKLAQILPHCEKREALADDRFGMEDMAKEVAK